MTAWSEVVAAEPEFAAAVQEIFEARRHKTIATLRADGSPRISGIEAGFVAGELCFGSMPGARKATDLRADPRFALHSPSVDPPEGNPSAWPGDAKISGVAVAVTDPERVSALLGESGAEPGQPGQLFRAEVAEVVRTRVGDPPDHLVIELWGPGRGVRRFERR